MDILNVSIDANKPVGNNLILIGVRPYYRYEDGKKTDKVEGYRYDIVLANRKYEQISVKIAGEQRLAFTEDDSGIPVKFENLELRIYYQWHPSSYDVSATATDIHPLKQS